LGLKVIDIEEVSTRSVYCGSDKSHSMCLPDLGSNCGSHYIVGQGFNEGQKNEMLDIHNSLRAQVASGSANGLPAAGNMRKLTWNNDLATVAQKWANQCIFDHDKNRLIPGYKSVGQNVYLQKISRKVPGIHIGKTVKKWFDEIDDFNQNQIEPFDFTMSTGHFTQLAWADTHEIGCGWANWMEGSRWKRIVVCNYAPGGNWIGSSMYKRGNPCSKCPSDTNCSPGGNLCI